jgi:hypothetical protein
MEQTKMRSERTKVERSDRKLNGTAHTCQLLISFRRPRYSLEPVINTAKMPDALNDHRQVLTNRLCSAGVRKTRYGLGGLTTGLGLILKK